MNIPSKVRLIDVGPRDGLQNEKQPVPAAVKIEPCSVCRPRA